MLPEHAYDLIRLSECDNEEDDERIPKGNHDKNRRLRSALKKLRDDEGSFSKACLGIKQQSTHCLTRIRKIHSIVMVFP